MDNLNSSGNGFSNGQYPNNSQSGYTPNQNDYQNRQNYYQGQSPSYIYNNQSGSDPQYHYGMPRNNFVNDRYLEEQRRRMLERRHHEKKLRSEGNKIGIALSLLLVLSLIFSFGLILPNFSKLYSSSVAFQSAYGIIYSVFTVGLSFFAVSKIFGNNKVNVEHIYSAPADTTKSILIILMCFGGCNIANYITSIIRVIGESIGIYSTYTAAQSPKSTLDVILMFLSTAVIPPLIEEFALRGVALQNLKKYGNSFAIIASAFTFAILHGNAVQIPFAFMCGLLLGYAVLATDSIWVSIIIHALVNFMSCLYSALTYYTTETVATTVYNIFTIGGIILGVLAFALYLIRYKNDATLKNKGAAPDMPLKTKFGKFISSPVMIATTIIFAIEAIATLSLSATTY